MKIEKILIVHGKDKRILGYVVNDDISITHADKNLVNEVNEIIKNKSIADITDNLSLIEKEDKKSKKLSIYKKIDNLEKRALRPLRELQTPLISVNDKSYAEDKLSSIETKIKALRAKL